ncbi:sulfatase [Chthoniobacter flavus Ellin428]|uniref:Sulfatase n=2 Tax=Chthoniobacter flavus TaxID=191863 RepID=B4CW66_9BACT|nr:sulfatase [Chthoniobacter flavus Ellin428]TCO95596.1 arylsulfatase A-like enzyme [Chthoniobacter flavus]
MKLRLFIVLNLLLVSISLSRAADHPNILWLVCEDATSTWIGCYGNSETKTPNIDAFARQGFRYTHAFASAPVCAPSRSGWITGINALSLGTLPMRSRYSIPHNLIKYYPDYLRQAGYYTSNHTKTDYNIGGRPDEECWDDKVADGWRKRKPGQPFFQVINFNESHESRAFGDCLNTRHSPGEVTLFKYHPDEMGIRMNYAKYYDAVENMDTQVGKALEALDKAGLAEDTIVIFNSDHGGVMPGSKRFLFDAGIHAPLIVRIPEKFKHLWPAASPGSTVDRLVSFVDMPKTWLSLAGAEIPAVMQGHIFLGPNTEPEPPYAFSFRERMDERFDNERSVRDKHYAYIKNYMPYIIWGQHLDYLWKLLAMRTWEDAYKNHRTDAVTGRFFTTKPVEELYDMDADPDNVVNLADKPECRKTLETMRAKLREWQLSIHDSAMLPEAERLRRAEENKLTVYEMVRDPKLYDLPSYLDAADLALAKDPANKPRLLQCLQSPDSGLRYWGTVGLLMLGQADAKVQAAVKPLLDDPCGEVAAMSAWILIQSGDTAEATKALADRLQKHPLSTLFILNVLDWSHTDLGPYVSALDSLPSVGSNDDMFNDEKIMNAYLRESNGLPVPPGLKEVSEKQKEQNAVKDK